MVAERHHHKGRQELRTAPVNVERQTPPLPARINQCTSIRVLRQLSANSRRWNLKVRRDLWKPAAKKGLPANKDVSSDQFCTLSKYGSTKVPLDQILNFIDGVVATLKILV